MGERGPARTPTAISDAKGYYIKHPERKPVNEPIVTEPLGGPPTKMTKDEKKVWKELAKQVPPGVAKVSDRGPFEILVRLFTKERAGTLKVGHMGSMLSLFSRFGMTPSDRAKVHGDAPPSDELEDFLIQ